MKNEDEVREIIDDINKLIDFIKDVSVNVSYDPGSFKILGNLRLKFNDNLLSDNDFIVGYAKNKFSNLLYAMQLLYEDEKLPRDSFGNFDWEQLTEAKSDKIRNLVDNILNLSIEIDKMVDALLNLKAQSIENTKIRSLNANLKDENEKLTQKNTTLENAVSNKKVVALYQGLEVENKKYFNLYRNLFIATIGLTVFIATTYNPLSSVAANIVELMNAIFRFDYKKDISDGASLTFNLPTLKYFVFKFSVIIVGITLTTYFLRLSSFYQSKYEQAKQTRLELEAFPDYASLLKPETAEDLRKELALKYFGKEVDQTQNDKIGDLIKDQLAAGTELIKASVELVKAKGSSTPPP